MPVRGSQSRRWPAAALATALGATTLFLCLLVPPAGAVVTDIGESSYGVTPIKGVSPASVPGARVAAGAQAPPGAAGPVNFDGGGPLLSHGGPVMHSITSHLIYWDPNSEFTAPTKGIFSKFFTDIAHDKELASNLFALTGQYTDETGRALYNAGFAGEKTDTAAYPASGCTVPKGVVAGEIDEGPPYTNCLTDAQLKTQLSAYIAAEKLPVGPTQQYFVLLPHKVVTCLKAGSCSNNVYCAYHSVINPGPEEVIYSDIPFSLLDSEWAKACQNDGNIVIQHPNGDATGSDAITKYADVATKSTSHEYIEAATDPLLNNWFDIHGDEIGDKCNGVSPNPEHNGIGYDANSFLPTLGGSLAGGALFDQEINTDHYYLQSEWDNAAAACEMQPVALSGVGFTNEPTSGLVGSPVSFKGAAFDLYAGLSVVWKWGDGTTSTGLTPAHTYAAAGKYEVTMTANDEFVFLTAPPAIHTIDVSKASQTISFTTSHPGSGRVGGTYEVAAEASPSKLPVVLTADASSAGVCSKAGSTVEFKAIGACTIDANQTGDSTYNAAAQAQQVVAVTAPQLTQGSLAGARRGDRGRLPKQQLHRRRCLL